MIKSKKIVEKVFGIMPNQIDEVPHNQEYESIQFDSNSSSYQSRLARKTPKKKGYFLANWIKDESNINIPYSTNNFSDFLIVLIIDEANQGYFNFPKEILVEKGIIMTDTSKGKMAFRVYPPWETDLNTTALKTQNWQIQYFTNIKF